MELESFNNTQAIAYNNAYCFFCLDKISTQKAVRRSNKLLCESCIVELKNHPGNEQNPAKNPAKTDRLIVDGVVYKRGKKVDCIVKNRIESYGYMFDLFVYQALVGVSQLSALVVSERELVSGLTVTGQIVAFMDGCIFVKAV